jgi:hypothetical protein
MLVQSQAPSVFMHMLRFGVQPLKVAFPWLMFGFSGTLDVCEVMRDVTRHTSHVTRHTSHVTRHTSHVTRHMSHVTRHTSHYRCCSCGTVSSRTTRCCLLQCSPPPYLCSGRGQPRARHTSHVTRHTSHVTRHTSHVTRHTSHVTRHTSHVTRHTSHVTRHTSHVTRHTSHVTRHTRSKAILDSSNADMINEVFEDLTRIRFCNRFSALNEQCVCGT